MPEFSAAADVYDRARPWQYRVVRASLATTTGCIVQAMFLCRPRKGPAFGKTCDILTNGTVVTAFRKDGKWVKRYPIGSSEAVRDNMRKLADHCKLNDTEREALFDELRKWVRRDYRAVSVLS